MQVVVKRKSMPKMLFADAIMSGWWDKLIEWCRANKREIRIGALPFNGDLTWHVVVPDNGRRNTNTISGAGRTFEAAFEDLYGQWALAMEKYDG